MPKHPSTQTLEFLHKYLDSCDNYTSGLGSCYEDKNRVEGGQFMAESVCVPCMIDRYLKTKKIPGPNANPWTKIRQGPGSGPHDSGGDGYPFNSCHICNGVEPTQGAKRTFIAEAIGHKKDCPYES